MKKKKEKKRGENEFKLNLFTLLVNVYNTYIDVIVNNQTSKAIAITNSHLLINNSNLLTMSNIKYCKA